MEGVGNGRCGEIGACLGRCGWSRGECTGGKGGRCGGIVGCWGRWGRSKWGIVGVYREVGGGGVVGREGEGRRNVREKEVSEEGVSGREGGWKRRWEGRE